MRLIDADELKIDYGFTWDDITPTHEEMYALIDRQPTIEPERKKGKWIELDFTEVGEYKCNQCGRLSDFEENYCPWCGADMKGDQCDRPN